MLNIAKLQNQYISQPQTRKPACLAFAQRFPQGSKSCPLIPLAVSNDSPLRPSLFRPAAMFRARTSAEASSRKPSSLIHAGANLAFLGKHFWLQPLRAQCKIPRYNCSPLVWLYFIGRIIIPRICRSRNIPTQRRIDGQGVWI